MRCQSPSFSKRVGLFAAAWLLAAALLVPAPVSAEGEEMIEGGEVISAGEGEMRGMPASNPRVKSILADHPGDLVTICVAGCDGKPTVVQMLPKPSERRIGGMRTTSGAGPGWDRPAYGVTGNDAVTCLAGCDGTPGQVLQRVPGLPAQKTAAPPAGKGRDEPLDVH